MKYTYRFFNYGVYDYKNAEIMLNSMAERGYIFKTTGHGWYKFIAWFEKDDSAKKTKFGVDVRCGLGKTEKEEYYRFYEDIGWKNIDCFKKKLHIFVNTGNEDNEIYTDPSTEFENLKEAIKDDIPNIKKLLLMIFCLALTFFVGRAGAAVLDRNLAFAYIFIMFLLILNYMAEIVGNFIYKRQSSSLVDENKFISENSVAKELRLYEKISNIIFLPILWVAIMIFYGRNLWEQWLINGSQIDIVTGLYIAPFIGLCFSLPGIALFTYLVFRKPEKDIYKVMSWFFSFLFYFGFISALQQYSLGY